MWRKAVWRCCAVCFGGPQTSLIAEGSARKLPVKYKCGFTPCEAGDFVM